MADEQVIAEQTEVYDDDTSEVQPAASDAVDIFDVDDEPEVPSMNEPVQGSTGKPAADDTNPRPEGTSEAKPAEKPAAQPTETVEADPTALDPEAVSIAKSAGMTDEDLQGIDQAELDRRLLWASRKGWLKAPTEQPAKVEPKPKADEKPPAEIKKYELPKDLDQYDETIVRAFREMNDHYAAQIEEIAAKTAKVDHIDQELQSRRQAEHINEMLSDVAEFDKMIVGLGSEYTDMFGEGDSLKLEPGTPAFKNRDVVLKEMIDLAQLYRNAGRRVPSRPELFDRALHNVHGSTITQKTKQSARQEVSKAVQERSRAAMGRPAVRNGTKVQSPEDAGVEFQKKFLAERGIPWESNGSDDEDRDSFL